MPQKFLTAKIHALKIVAQYLSITNWVLFFLGQSPPNGTKVKVHYVGKQFLTNMLNFPLKPHFTFYEPNREDWKR